MLRLSPEQKKELFHLGDGTYDVSEGLVLRGPVFFMSLSKMTAEGVRNFLDYQYSNTKYPKIFLCRLRDIVKMEGAHLPKENLAQSYNWLESILPFKLGFQTQVDELFVENKDYKPLILKEWEESLHKFVNNKPMDEVPGFLSYGIEMLQEGLKLHNIVCSNPYECKVNESFKWRIEICERLIQQLNTQLNEESSTPNFNRMEWLGTQKQLGELFVQLKRKGWIESIEYEAIKNCFTKSNTIHQILKPAIDPKTYDETYEQIFTSQYESIFFGIKENRKKPK